MAGESPSGIPSTQNAQTEIQNQIDEKTKQAEKLGKEVDEISKKEQEKLDKAASAEKVDIFVSSKEIDEKNATKSTIELEITDLNNKKAQLEQFDKDIATQYGVMQAKIEQVAANTQGAEGDTKVEDIKKDLMAHLDEIVAEKVAQVNVAATKSAAEVEAAIVSTSELLSKFENDDKVQEQLEAISFIVENQAKFMEVLGKVKSYEKGGWEDIEEQLLDKLGDELDKELSEEEKNNPKARETLLRKKIEAFQEFVGFTKNDKDGKIGDKTSNKMFDLLAIVDEKGNTREMGHGKWEEDEQIDPKITDQINAKDAQKQGIATVDPNNPEATNQETKEGAATPVETGDVTAEGQTAVANEGVKQELPKQLAGKLIVDENGYLKTKGYKDMGRGKMVNGKIYWEQDGNVYKFDKYALNNWPNVRFTKDDRADSKKKLFTAEQKKESAPVVQVAKNEEAPAKGYASLPQKNNQSDRKDKMI
jgi:hypothetical protein